MLSKSSKTTNSDDSGGSQPDSDVPNEEEAELTGEDGGERAKKDPPAAQHHSSGQIVGDRQSSFLAVRNMRLMQARRRRVQGRQSAAANDTAEHAPSTTISAKAALAERDRREHERLVQQELREATVEVVKSETFERATITLEEQAQRSVWLFAMFDERQAVVEGLAKVRPTQRESNTVAVAQVVTPSDDSRSTSPAPQAPPASLTHLASELAAKTQAGAVGDHTIVAHEGDVTEQQTSPASNSSVPERSDSRHSSISTMSPLGSPEAAPRPVLPPPPPVVPVASAMELAAAFRAQTIHWQQQEMLADKEDGVRRRLVAQEDASFTEFLRTESEEATALQERVAHMERMMTAALEDVANACASPEPSLVATSHKAIESSNQFRRARDRLLDESKAMLQLEEASGRNEISEDEAIFFQTSIVLPYLMLQRKALVQREGLFRRNVENVQERAFMRDVMALHKYFASVEDLLPGFFGEAEVLLTASKKALDGLARMAYESNKRLREVGQVERVHRVDIAAQEDEYRDLIERYHSHDQLRRQLFQTKSFAKSILAVESFEMAARLDIRGLEEWSFRTTIRLAVISRAIFDDFHHALSQLDRAGQNGLRSLISEIGHDVTCVEDAARDALLSSEKQSRSNLRSTFLKLLDMTKIFDMSRHGFELVFDKAARDTTNFFDRLKREALDVRRVVSTLFFTPLKDTQLSVGIIDTTSANFTDETVELLLAFVGGRRCHIDRLVVSRGVPSAAKLLALNCWDISLRQCGIRDEHLSSPCSFMPQWAESMESCRCDQSRESSKHHVDFSTPMEYLKYWERRQQLGSEKSGDGESASLFFQLDVEGNDLGVLAYDTLVELLKAPRANFFVDGVSGRNDGFLPYQKLGLHFLTQLNRQYCAEKRRRQHTSGTVSEQDGTAENELLSGAFAAFGARADIKVLADFRTFLAELVAPSTHSTELRLAAGSSAILSASDGRVVMMKRLKLPRQSDRLQSALTLFFEGCRVDHARQSEVASSVVVKSLDMSWLGLSDTDVPFLVSHIFSASSEEFVLGLRSIDFSNNFLSRNAITQLEAALRECDYYEASNFTLTFDGNLNSQDVYQHEETQRSSVYLLEVRERGPLVHYCDYQHNAVAMYRTYMNLLTTSAQPIVDQAAAAVSATRSLTRLMHDLVFEESVVRRSLTETYADATEVMIEHSGLMNGAVGNFASAESRLEQEHSIAIECEMQRSRLALNKLRSCDELLREYRQDLHHFQRYHAHVSALDSLVSVEFPDKCSNLFGAGEEQFSEIRAKLARQPKALRDAVYRTMQPMRFFDAPSKQILDLSRPSGVAALQIPPSQDHVVSNFSVPIIADVIRKSHSTPHPIRHLSLRNCVGLMDMDTALPALLDLCPLLESIDLTNCGLANRHVDALCDLIAKHGPEYAPANGHQGLFTSLYISGNAFTLSDMHRILSEMRESNLPLMELGDENRTHELAMKSVIDLANFYSALNSRRNPAFKAKLLAIARDDPFFLHANFDVAMPQSSEQQDSTDSPKKSTSFRLPQQSSPFHSPARRPTGSFEEVASPAPTTTPQQVADASSTALDDESLPLLLFALSQNAHIKTVSLRGNKLSDDGIAQLVEFLEPRLQTTQIVAIQLDGNPCSRPRVEEVQALITKKFDGVCNELVIQPEEGIRKRLSYELQQQHRSGLVSDYALMHEWLKGAAGVEADAAVLWNRIVVSAFRSVFSSYTSHESQVRSELEQHFANFFVVAFEYFTLVNMIVPWSKHFSDMKHAFVEEAVESLDTVRNIVRSLDPSLQAVAVHIARNNPFVDTLDLSDAFVEEADGNATVDAIAQLMRLNTHIRELSFANAGPFINSNRSVPIIAEIGIRLEALDLTNCGVTDALIGSLAVMITDPKCELSTLILDSNRITARGAQKLAKAIRVSKTLSLVSLAGNPQMSRDANQLIRFYCDLNKFTPAFKETILRVEANDPTLTEINFERRGNTDEKTIFDDTSMRLLCAALPHNTNVRRILISGNHVSDDGAMSLMNLLKANVNRTVSHVDLSGNDISSDMLDEVNRLQFYRMHEVVRWDIVGPEFERREQIYREEHFYFSVALVSLFQHDMLMQLMVDEFLHDAQTFWKSSACAATLHYSAVRFEEQRRVEIEMEMSSTRQLLLALHHYILTELNAMFLQYLRLFRSELSSAKDALESLWDMVDRQPNEELRRQSFHIMVSDPRSSHLDLSAGTSPSSDDTIKAALMLLSNNSSVRSMSLSGNSHLSRDMLRSVLKTASTRLESLDLSYCNIGDDLIEIIEDTIFSPQSTLRSITLDGNTFTDRAAGVLGNRFSACAMSSQNEHIVVPPRVTCKNCPLVLESTTKNVEFAVELNQCPDRVRALIVDILTTDPVVVDASTVPLSEGELKLMCLAISRVKRTRGIRMQGTGISDIGVSYLVKLLRSMPLLLAVQILGTTRSMSSVAREELRQCLQLKLQATLEQEVVTPESIVREDIIYDQSFAARYVKHYNAVGRIVSDHYSQGVRLFASWSGSQLAETSLIPQEESDRRKVWEKYAEVLRVLDRHHQHIRSLDGTCCLFASACSAYLEESRSVIDEAIRRFVVKQCRDLRWKAFSFALNDLTISTLNLSGSWQHQSTTKVLRLFAKHNTHLKELNVSSNDILDLDSLLLCLLELCCPLTSLNLTNCGLTDSQMTEQIIPFLEDPRCRIEKLILDRNQLTATSLGALLTSLRDKCHCLSDVTGKFVDDGSRDTAASLRFLCGLNSIVARSRGARGSRDEFVRVKRMLIDCYSNKSFLTTLNFTGDAGMQLLALDDRFGKLLCEALEHNTTVRSVNLQNHQITNAGAIQLLPVLTRQECAIRAVFLDGNFVTEELLKLVQFAMDFRDMSEDTNRSVKEARSHKERLFEESVDMTLALGSAASMISSEQAHSREEIEVLQESQHAILQNYFAFLRFCLAWEKSYRFAFEKHSNEVTSSMEAIFAVRQSATRRRSSGSSSLPASPNIKDPRLAELPPFLADRYMQFVTASSIYEEKCFAALERVFVLASQLEDLDDGESSFQQRRRSSSQGRSSSFDFNASPPPQAAESILIAKTPTRRTTSAGSSGGGDLPFPPRLATPLQGQVHNTTVFSSHVPDAEMVDFVSHQQRTVSPMVGTRSTPTVERPSSSSHFRRDQTPTRVERSLEAAPFAALATYEEAYRRPTPITTAAALPPRPPSSGMSHPVSSLEALALDDKLSTRFAKYQTQVEAFEKKCINVLQALHDQYCAAIQGGDSTSPRQGEWNNVSSSPNQPPLSSAPSQALMSSSSFSTPAGDALSARLQDRFERYTAGVASFTEKCVTLMNETYDKEAQAKRRKSSAIDPTPAEVALIRQQSGVQILRAPEAKLEQVFKILASQPPDLQQKAKQLIDNERSVTFVDLSSATNAGYEVTDITIGVLYTVLQGNDSVKSISFAGGALQNISPASAKAIVRMSLRLESLDLSGSRVSDAVKLYPALLAAKSLKSLSLDDCELSGEVLSHMLAALRSTNSTLRTLGLRNVPPTVDKNLVSFTVFYVECNRQNETIPLFKETLLKIENGDPELTGVKGFAFNSHFTDASLRLLCIALTRNTTVSVLDLSRTSITDKGCRFVATLMKSSKMLTHISVAGCAAVTDVGREELRQASLGGRIQLAV